MTLPVPEVNIEAERPGPRPSAPWARWSLLALLLVAELVGLMLRFSKDGLPESGDWKVRFLREASPMLAMGGGIGAAALALGGPFLFAGWQRLGFRSYSRRSTGWIALGQLAAFAALYRLTGQLLERGALSTPHSLAWFSAWASTGLAMLGLWSIALAPLGVWKALAGRVLGALAIGGVVSGSVLVASSATREWWSNPLRHPTFWIVKSLLSLACPEVVCHPETYSLGTPEFTVEIMPMCSGYEGIGLIWVFSAAYLIINRRSLRFPHALLLVPLGTLAIWLANGMRIAALILLGAWYSPELAEGTFHSLAGWAGLNVVAVGVMLLSQRLKFFQARADSETVADVASPATVENPAPPYLAPVLALIAAGMILGAFPTGGFDRYYPIGVAATLAALWPFRRRYAAMGPWSVSWQAVGVGVLTFAGWMALEPFYRSPGAVDTATPTALAGMSRIAALGWLAFRVFGSVVTVPLAEELAFRAFLTRRLIASDFEEVPPGRFTWPSFLISSLAFGLLHQRWLAGTLAGMAYALVYYRRGRIADPVIAHATTNALIAAWVLATGDWATWA